MENNNSVLLKNSLNGGIIMGLVGIIFAVGLFVFDYMPVGFKGIPVGIGALVINIVILIFLMKSYRNNVLGGYMTFGQAFIFALLVSVFSTILSAVFNYVFYAFIDPEYGVRLMEANKDWVEGFMLEKGLPESAIADAIEKAESKGVITPLKSVKQALIGGTIFGVILSLIMAAIMKKNEEIPTV